MKYYYYQKQDGQEPMEAYDRPDGNVSEGSHAGGAGAAGVNSVSPQSSQPAATAPAVQKEQPDTEYTKKMKEGFGYFGPAVFLYAFFYTFCMYKNASGVTFPFFMAGSLLFLYLCLSKLGISLKKDSIFYMISMMLLAVSSFTTDDGRIIALNKTGIFLLMISLLLNQLYDTSKWQLGKYLKSIFTVTFASLGELNRPFADGNRFRKTLGKSGGGKIFYVIVGLAAVFPLFLLVFFLLYSADAVFREITRKMLEIVTPADMVLVPLTIVFMFLAVYCMLSYFCKKSIPEDVADTRRGEPVLAITVTSVLTLLYLVFSVIQILYLFLGRMQLPAEYTYAEYAREGFFQLLAVSILNLIIVLVSLNYFKESKVLKGILTAMSFCTFIMIASSGVRMMIYIQYYYLTFLRIFVLWSLAVLAILFAGVIVSIFREGFPLFSFSAKVVTVCFLLLSFSQPDYLIAKINIANMPGQETHPFFKGEPYQDYDYLSTLSADAAPVLIPYLAKQGYDMDIYNETEFSQNREPRYKEAGFGYYYMLRLKQKVEDSSWRHFNVSRHLAMKRIEQNSR